MKERKKEYKKETLLKDIEIGERKKERKKF